MPTQWEWKDGKITSTIQAADTQTVHTPPGAPFSKETPLTRTEKIIIVVGGILTASSFAELYFLIT